MPIHGEKLIIGLSALLQLGKRAFAAEDESAFSFLVVNETHLMAPYRQAVLWQRLANGGGKVVAVSGSPEASSRAPYIAWLARVLDRESIQQRQTPLCLSATDIPGEDGAAWEQWLPAHALWAPLVTGLGEMLGGMLLVKSTPWTDPEMKLLGKLADSYANAWELIRKRHDSRGIFWKPLLMSYQGRLKIGLLLVVLLSCWLPVQQSVLAPATVKALNPLPVRAPIDGVIDRVHVIPNQMVHQGDLLITLDEAVLANKLDVETKSYNLLQEEYRQVLKQSVTDPEVRVQKKILEKRMEKQDAEMRGVRIQLNRVRILAPRDGVAIFSDSNHWLGKPVQVGERIMEVADPSAAELEIRLPVNDMIALDGNARVTLYPNLDPLDSRPGTVTYVSYDAQEIEGVIAYTLRAHFLNGETPPKIGLRGTAKIYGRQTTLFFYLFRHPLALLRQRLG
ncbi:MAG: HlyD family efflux transporter periplasmic adaptor subunit [Magnetococcales bacterium]|nr:HlyD family efflux transporter periplasmic adaptor subunit [Magnetococcales bacterium]